MAEHSSDVWKGAELASTFLTGVRGAIPLAQEQLDVMLRLVAAVEGPVGGFLDVGCGDGVLAAAILERFPAAEAVLIDFSEPMLDAARARFAGREPMPRIHNIDYGDSAWTRTVQSWAPFDAIVSGYSIHHQPDARKREIYGEIFALLRPGGLFVNVEHVASASPWLAARADDLMIDSLHRHHAERSRDDVAREFFHRPDKAANILAPVEAQCGWLRDAGFTDADCFLKIFELAVFGGRKPVV